MNRAGFLLVGCVVTCQGWLLAQQTPPAPAASTAKTLTLAEAVDVALKNNRTVEAAGAYAEAVRSGIKTAQAARYPSVDFSESFTRGNNPVYVFGTLLTQRQFTAENFDLGFLNVPPPLDNFRTQFAAAMPLWDAGQTSRRVRDARLNSEGAEQALNRTRQEVVFSVIRAYLNAMLARESVQVAESSVEMATSDAGRARTRQEQGQAVLSDVLGAQVQLAQAKEDLIRAQNAVALAHATLNTAMGVPEDTPSEVQGTLAEVTFEARTLAERQERALSARPDYLQATIGSERATNGVNMARAEFLPTIRLFGSWEMDRMTFAGQGGNNWLAGATLNFNLFSGGANRAQVAESRSRQRQAEALRSELASQIRLQVREAFLNLESARQRVEVSRESASQADESLRILRDRYDTGLATITDVLHVETMRTTAQRNSLNAAFDYRIAFAALELATGELGPDSPAVKR